MIIFTDCKLIFLLINLIDTINLNYGISNGIHYKSAGELESLQVFLISLPTASFALLHKLTSLLASKLFEYYLFQSFQAIINVFFCGIPA